MSKADEITLDNEYVEIYVHRTTVGSWIARGAEPVRDTKSPDGWKRKGDAIVMRISRDRLSAVRAQRREPYERTREIVMNPPPPSDLPDMDGVTVRRIKERV